MFYYLKSLRSPFWERLKFRSVPILKNFKSTRGCRVGVSYLVLTSYLWFDVIHISLITTFLQPYQMSTMNHDMKLFENIVITVNCFPRWLHQRCGGSKDGTVDYKTTVQKIRLQNINPTICLCQLRNIYLTVSILTIFLHKWLVLTKKRCWGYSRKKSAVRCKTSKVHSDR